MTRILFFLFALLSLCTLHAYGQATDSTTADIPPPETGGGEPDMEQIQNFLNTPAPAPDQTLLNTAPLGATQQNGNSPLNNFSPDMILAMFQGAAAQLPFRPVASGYYIGDGVPALDVTNLKYTAKDLTRFDSYSPSLANFVSTPSVVPSTLSATLGATTAAANVNTYAKVINNTVMSGYYTVAYSWYRGFQLSTYDLLQELVQNNNLAFDNVILNMTMGINERYNVYRATWQAANPGKSFDTVEITDWNAQVPGVKDFSTWLERYLNAFFNIQIMTHQIVPRASAGGGPWPDFDAFGLFANNNGYGVGVTDFGQMWTLPSIGYLCSRWAHLLSSSFLSRTRKNMMAALTALRANFALQNLPNYQSNAQWLLRVTSYSNTVNYIMQAEKLLRARGDWKDSVDLVNANNANITNGLWTNDQMLSQTHTELDKMVNFIKVYGISEYLSAYYGYTMNVLSFSLPHCPDQYTYEGLDWYWQQLWRDIALHYLPGAGVMSGPMARIYDMFVGASTQTDRYDFPNYVQILFKPYCAANPTVQLCLSAQFNNPPSGDYAMPIDRVMFTMWNAGGQGSLPLQQLVDYNINMPYRQIKQRFNVQTGQERMNFVTPNFSIGWSGEDLMAASAAIWAAARLSGTPNAGIPTYGDARALPYIRLMMEITDNPADPGGEGVPGLNENYMTRQITTQSQGFTLITQLAASQYNWGANELASCLNTDLFLPLAADAIYINGVKMPTAIGSAYAVPPNAIITVRHKGASVIIRQLYHEHAPNIPEATSVFKIDDNSFTAVGTGKQPYSLVYQVDTNTYAQGLGRLVVHHKHKGDTANNRPYRLAWLWAAADTASDSEMKALETLLLSSNMNMQFVNKNWNVTTMTPTGPLTRDLSPVGQSQWFTAVAIGSQLTLSVDRTDVYQTWGFAPIFQAGALHVAPFYVQPFSRQVNGQELMQWNTGDDWTKVTSYAQSEIYAPHLALVGQLPLYNTNNGKAATSSVGCPTCSGSNCALAVCPPVLSTTPPTTSSTTSASSSTSTSTSTSSSTSTSTPSSGSASATYGPDGPYTATRNAGGYGWNYGAWSACSNGLNSRNVACQDTNGNNVQTSLCTGAPLPWQKPCNVDTTGASGSSSTATSCVDATYGPNGPYTATRNAGGYGWNYGAWTTTCSNGFYTRNVACQDTNGNNVQTILCTGSPLNWQKPCTYTTVCSTSATSSVATTSSSAPTSSVTTSTSTPTSSSTASSSTSSTYGPDGPYTATRNAGGYGWNYGAWSACSNGLNSRNVACQDTNGNNVQTSLCTGAPLPWQKPCTVSTSSTTSAPGAGSSTTSSSTTSSSTPSSSTTSSSSSTSTCVDSTYGPNGPYTATRNAGGYGWNYGAWSAACNNGFYTRNVACQDTTGTNVYTGLCTGSSLNWQKPCSYVSTCSSTSSSSSSSVPASSTTSSSTTSSSAPGSSTPTSSSTPVVTTPVYTWVYGAWTACSKPACTLQLRTAQCVNSAVTPAVTVALANCKIATAVVSQRCSVC